VLQVGCGFVAGRVAVVLQVAHYQSLHFSFGAMYEPVGHPAHTHTHTSTCTHAPTIRCRKASLSLPDSLSLSLSLSLSRGGVTRQGVVLTDLQSLLDCQ
jgi:hypothetical protein